MNGFTSSSLKLTSLLYRVPHDYLYIRLLGNLKIVQIPFKPKIIFRFSAINVYRDGGYLKIIAKKKTNKLLLLLAVVMGSSSSSSISSCSSSSGRVSLSKIRIGREQATIQWASIVVCYTHRHTNVAAPPP